MEIPIDLIKHSQISLRRRANLPSYHPDSGSPVRLPSTEEAAAALDPSPADLRCRHCHARLLRGSRSLICVFCGRDACNDAVPEPIDFRNTLGCRWLLDSLDLDGSEFVTPSGEDHSLHRGRTLPKDELPLSDLLNLEIKWSSELENFGFRLSNEKPVQRNNPVNSLGVTEIKVSAEARGNLSLFENAPTEDDASYFDSGFEADFQSAPTRTTTVETVLFDRFVGSQELSSQMDEVFGNVKDSSIEAEGVVTSESSLSMASSWFDGPSREIKVPENVKSLSPVELDTNTNEGEDSFEDWNDFAGSTSAPDRWKQSTISAGEKNLETDIFGSCNPTRDISLFDDFSQPDIFRGEFCASSVPGIGDKESAEAHILDRAANAITEVGEDSDVQQKTNEASSEAGDAEKILSQMHDLSFMLGGNLLVPSKQDGTNN